MEYQFEYLDTRALGCHYYVANFRDVSVCVVVHRANACRYGRLCLKLALLCAG